MDKETIFIKNMATIDAYIHAYKELQLEDRLDPEQLTGLSALITNDIIDNWDRIKNKIRILEMEVREAKEKKK